MSGIEKEVDSLGRVVIPIEYRKKLGIEKNARVTVSLEKGYIKISPASLFCLICGVDVGKCMEIRLCDDCIAKVRDMADKDG